MLMSLLYIVIVSIELIYGNSLYSVDWLNIWYDGPIGPGKSKNTFTTIFDSRPLLVMA